MNIKIRAFIRSLGILAACFAGSMATMLFFKYFPIEYIPHLFIAGMIGMLIYVGYSISLNQLEAEETLKEISKKY